MAGAADSPWRETADGVALRVRLTPKGGRDAVDGIATTPEGPALKARVRSAPEDGAANAALEALLADWLDLPRRTVTLIGGHKSRTKMVAIAGDPRDIRQRLAACAAALTTD